MNAYARNRTIIRNALMACRNIRRIRNSTAWQSIRRTILLAALDARKYR